jgi:hypothetical protein
MGLLSVSRMGKQELNSSETSCDKISFFLLLLSFLNLTKDNFKIVKILSKKFVKKHVKKLEKKGQKVFKQMSTNCQKTIKKLSISVKMLSKKLSKCCQKVVRKLSKFVNKLSKFVIILVK